MVGFPIELLVRLLALAVSNDQATYPYTLRRKATTTREDESRMAPDGGLPKSNFLSGYWPWPLVTTKALIRTSASGGERPPDGRTTRESSSVRDAQQADVLKLPQPVRELAEKGGKLEQVAIGARLSAALIAAHRRSSPLKSAAYRRSKAPLSDRSKAPLALARYRGPGWPGDRPCRVRALRRPRRARFASWFWCSPATRSCRSSWP